MLAYNREWLDNILTRNAAASVLAEGFITKEEAGAVYKNYPVEFYTPNYFIRLGLFVLTVVIMLFSFGLLILITLNSIEKMWGGLAIFFSMLCYAALEFMVRVKKHHCSGVDDALLYGSAFALFAGISFPHDFGGMENSMLAFMIGWYATFRFADKVMAAVSFVALLGIFFYGAVEMGDAAKSIVPFIIMGVSIAVYILVTKMETNLKAVHYFECLLLIRVAALFSFYIAGNYFAVRELSNEMFHLNLQPGQSIPFGWLFWIFTCSVPFAYIARGIQKKDIVLIRTGLLLIAAIVLTIRYYHSILPVETLMVLGGLALLLSSYALMKFLRKPRHGFTYREIAPKNEWEKLHLESLIIAESFAPAAQQDHTQFGGGSFGGGGASGEF